MKSLLLLSMPILCGALYVLTVKQVLARRCPIVIDLNGNGRSDITGFTTSRQKLYTIFSVGSYVDFDINADGTPDRIDWIMGNTDGFLLDLRNGLPADGAMDGSYLFANTEGYDNGFEKLVKFDKDGDKMVSGAELKELAIWRDDGNAKFEPGELQQLSEYNIQSLGTAAWPTSTGYGVSSLVSSAMTSSSSIFVEDVWFLSEGEVPELDNSLGRFLKNVGKNVGL